MGSYRSCTVSAVQPHSPKVIAGHIIIFKTGCIFMYKNFMLLIWPTLSVILVSFVVLTW